MKRDFIQNQQTEKMAVKCPPKIIFPELEFRLLLF